MCDWYEAGRRPVSCPIMLGRAAAFAQKFRTSSTIAPSGSVAVGLLLRGNREGSGEDRMKGVVLAGGTGSRLFPLTKITNKHLLPIYDRPMIYYPIQTLVDAGIQDIMIVTGGRNSGDFLRLLANGKEFGLKHINYTYQEGEGGIADALALAQHFADGEKI